MWQYGCNPSIILTNWANVSIPQIWVSPSFIISMQYPRTGFDFKIQFQNQGKTNRYNVCVGVNSKKAAAVLILIDLIYYVIPNRNSQWLKRWCWIVNPLTTNQYSMGHAYHLYGMEQTTRVEPSHICTDLDLPWKTSINFDHLAVVISLSHH